MEQSIEAIEEKKRRQNDYKNNNLKDKMNWSIYEEHSLLIAIKALRCKEPSLISVLLNNRSVEEVIVIHIIIFIKYFVQSHSINISDSTN